MATTPPISDYMHAHPYTVGAEDTASSAEKFMLAHHIRHLPVVDGKRVMGVISERDIFVSRAIYKNRPFDGEVLVKDVCNFEPCMVNAEDSVTKVAALMGKKKLDAVVVMHGKDLAGIFTATDACRLLSECFGAGSGAKGFLAGLFGR